MVEIMLSCSSEIFSMALPVNAAPWRNPSRRRAGFKDYSLPHRQQDQVGEFFARLLQHTSSDSFSRGSRFCNQRSELRKFHHGSAVSALD
jgi:hypothetical protein